MEPENLEELIKDDKYKVAFFHILLKHYKKYLENDKKLVVPDEFKDSYYEDDCNNKILILPNKDGTVDFDDKTIIIVPGSNNNPY